MVSGQALNTPVSGSSHAMSMANALARCVASSIFIFPSVSFQCRFRAWCTSGRTSAPNKISDLPQNIQSIDCECAKNDVLDLKIFSRKYFSDAAKIIFFIFFQKCVKDTDAPIHNSSQGSKGVCTSGSPADPNCRHHERPNA